MPTRCQPLCVAVLVTMTGLLSAQSPQTRTEGAAKEQSEQRKTQGESATETLQSTARKAADEVGEALESTEQALEETLGSVKAGCLIRGDEADPFILIEEESGDRITVVGSEDLPLHVGHTVKIHGAEKSEGRVFHAANIEHVSITCENSNSRGASVAGYDRSETGGDPGSSNIRDRGVTAGDQGMSAADRKTTQAIRKAVTADETLSVYAKNVKIITQRGVVTLRGPVKSQQEKQLIEAKAAAVAGAGNVKNEITVEARPANRQRN